MVSRNSESLEEDFFSDSDVENSRDKVIELNKLLQDIEREPKTEIDTNTNIWYILGDKENEPYEDENAHSDFLAWLLRPKQTHGLGTIFLEKFIIETLNIDNINLAEAEIDREHTYKLSTKGHEQKKIDILIKLKDRVICIENKRDAPEGETQLEDYVQILEEEFPDMDHDYIFLTKDGKTPTHESYLAVSYSLVYKILKDMVDSNLVHKSEEVRVLIYIEDYMRVLKETLMIDDDIYYELKPIYPKYRQIIKSKELSFVNESPEWEEFFEILKNNNVVEELEDDTLKEKFKEELEKDFQLGKEDKQRIRFISKDMEEYFKTDSSTFKYLFMFEFEFNPKNIKFKALVPSKSTDLKEYKEKLLKILKKINGFNDENTTDMNGIYNIIEFEPVKDFDSDKEVKKIIEGIRDTVGKYEDTFSEHKKNLLEIKV
tara:strand:+ start:39 stop:1331 length:1293 start_codon:yes stop_codon:yes gene_type:complete